MWGYILTPLASRSKSRPPTFQWEIYTPRIKSKPGCANSYLALLNLERCYSVPGRQPVTIRAACVIRIIIDRHIFSTPVSKKRCGENRRDLFFGTVMSEKSNGLTSHSTATDLHSHRSATRFWLVMDADLCRYANARMLNDGIPCGLCHANSWLPWRYDTAIVCSLSTQTITSPATAPMAAPHCFPIFCLTYDNQTLRSAL